MKKYISEPYEPIEPSKISLNLYSFDSVTIGCRTFPEILSLLPEYTYDELSIEEISGDFGEEKIVIAGRKYEEVQNDKYEEEMEKYKKDLKEYKEKLKIWEDWKKQEKKKQKEVDERKELELYRKLEKKYGK